MTLIRLKATAAGLTGLTRDTNIQNPVPAGFNGQYLVELPRTMYVPAYVARTGTVRAVASGGNLQAALDAAVPGDTIVLDNAGVYQGNFNLPTNKSGGTGTEIYIESAAMRGGTFDTVFGNRKTTTTGLAILRHPGGTNVQPIISTTGNGRTGWRFAGIQIDVPSAYTGSGITSLIQLGDITQTTVAAYPGFFAFDRCRIIGTATAQIRRAIWVTGPNFYMGDSQILDISSQTVGDSQGILITHAAGIATISNVEIAGPTEPITVGGLDGNVIPDPLVIPYDVTIKKGWHHCQAYQDPDDVAWNGLAYNTKNLGEQKGGTRVSWTQMVLQRHLGNDQQFSLTLKGGGQNGQATAAAQDVTVQHIKFIDCSAGIQLKGFSRPGNGNSLQRVYVDNCALLHYHPTTRITPRVMELTDYSNQLELRRLTMLLGGSNTAISYIEPSGAGNMSDIRVTDSIMSAFYGMGIAGNVDAGMSGVISGDRLILRNLLVGRPNVYPATNVYPTNAAAVGFTSYADLASDNLLLSGASPYKGTGLSGADPGCDIAALNTATTGCVSGVWP
jgi:hypothetical protein